ncbi:MAG: hypothetical protein Q4C61_11965 [Lachnospiraceae bacterium]|nr:hypothetical protein [Lachnospiraceae bacterium]
MEQQYPKKSYRLFIIWLTAFAVILTAGALKKPNIAGLGAVKSVSVMLYVMLDTLFLLILLTQNIYWTAGVSYEEAAGAGTRARRNYALRQLAVFLAATAVYLAYCFVAAPRWSLGSAWDSMAAGAVVCIASAAAGRLRL